MNQYSCPLLALVLTVTSALSVAPCQAQTVPEANDNKTNNLNIDITPTINTNKSSQLDNSTSSNSEQTIISDAVSETSPNNTNLTAIKPNLRIPISSRIFSAPSMQQ